MRRTILSGAANILSMRPAWRWPGPAANFTLAILAGVSIQIGLHAHVFAAPDAIGFSSVVDAATPGFAEGAAKFFSLLFSLNILLGSFNLIPLPPLDGFNVIPLFLPRMADSVF